MFLENGANVNSADQTGNTPLHYAAKQGNTAIVRLLLEYGADTREIRKLLAEKAQESQRKYIESITKESRRRP